jgi:hypothetical protein
MYPSNVNLSSINASMTASDRSLRSLLGLTLSWWTAELSVQSLEP